MTFDKDWERFTGGPNKPNRERIHVTMNKGGLIYMNGNAHRMMNRPEAVQFYRNRSNDKLGLRPVSPHLSDAFPVKEKSGYYLIHASPVCRHYGIKLNSTEKFIDADVDAGGNLILDLSRTITVTRHR
jgi:hypothetical protein